MYQRILAEMKQNTQKDIEITQLLRIMVFGKRKTKNNNVVEYDSKDANAIAKKKQAKRRCVLRHPDDVISHPIHHFTLHCVYSYKFIKKSLDASNFMYFVVCYI